MNFTTLALIFVGLVAFIAWYPAYCYKRGYAQAEKDMRNKIHKDGIRVTVFGTNAEEPAQICSSWSWLRVAAVLEASYPSRGMHVTHMQAKGDCLTLFWGQRNKGDAT